MSSYTLYYSPGASSLSLHALLYSLAIPFDIKCVNIHKGENRSESYLALNPLGQVPILIEDGRVLRESAVIATYLIDKYHSPLLPKDADLRLEAMQWLSFCNTALHQAYSAYFLMSRNLQDEAVKEVACDLIARRIRYLWRFVETRLQKSPYLAGEVLTIADIFLAVIANWTSVLRHDIELGAASRRLCQEVADLPYFKQALLAEQITFTIG